uniref:VIT domain-containing protein n=1 Tax=Timema tahoe TaxID=61484 RepID=A0A7R9INE4_9NEOP|nr:unnamed protein product [Timema tahoe]
MCQSSSVMMCAPSFPKSLSRRYASMPISPAGVGMTTSVSVSPGSPGLFGMPEASTGVTMFAPLVTSFGFGSSQQSSPGLFGMPEANTSVPMSVPDVTSFGFGSSQQNSGEKDKNADTNKGKDGSHLQVSGLHVATNIQCDHATVILKFVFNNQIGVANDTEFKIPLPSSAVLSYCLMEVDGIEYKGVLDKTEAAQEQFKSAKLENKTAFLMRLSSEQEKVQKTAPLLLSFDLDKKSLPGQVLKSIPDVLKERVSIKKMVDGLIKDSTKQLQALELSLKHNFLSQLTAFYAVKLKD